VRIPRHIFGEMSKSSVGLQYLRERSIIQLLLRTVKDDKAPCVNRRAAMWGLGHIGAADAGCEDILGLDPGFIEWCVQCCCLDGNLSLRSTAFHVLGLAGRSKQGMRALQNLQWDVSPFYSNSAVAFPKDTSVLFQRDAENEISKIADVIEKEPSSGTLTAVLKPFSSAPSPELEVLNLIAKVSILRVVMVIVITGPLIRFVDAGCDNVF
jgi:hypothetical protein